MDIARGPTDNLYKFIALSGLAIAGLGIVLWSSLHSSFVSASIEASVSAETARHSVEALKRNWTWRMQVHEIEQDFIAMGSSEDPEKELRNIRESLDLTKSLAKYMEEQTDALEDVTTVLAEATIDSETAVATVRLYRWRKWVHLCLIVFGSALSAFGFYLWYVRLQKFLDKKIQQEVAE